jgi:hypothetical protein
MLKYNVGIKLEKKKTNSFHVIKWEIGVKLWK